jgi:hypothetical protein
MLYVPDAICRIKTNRCVPIKALVHAMFLSFKQISLDVSRKSEPVKSRPYGAEIKRNQSLLIEIKQLSHLHSSFCCQCNLTKEALSNMKYSLFHCRSRQSVRNRSHLQVADHYDHAMFSVFYRGGTTNYQFGLHRLHFRHNENAELRCFCFFTKREIIYGTHKSPVHFSYVIQNLESSRCFDPDPA